MWRKYLMIKKKIKEEIQKSQWQIKLKAIYKTMLFIVWSVEEI